MRNYKIKIKEIQDKGETKNSHRFYDHDALFDGLCVDSIDPSQIRLSTPLALTEHAFNTFGTAIKDGHAAPEIYNWLDSLDWLDLQAWNNARQIFRAAYDDNPPSKRQVKFLAIEDCVGWVYKELMTATETRDKILYFFNPCDFKKIAGLTNQHMKMTQFELGYELASKPATAAPVKPAPKTAPTKKLTKTEPTANKSTKKKSYASAVKIQNSKTRTIIGKSSANIGIKPKQISLYLRVPTGGDISKIVETIKKRKSSKAIDIKTTLFSKTKNFNSYQLQCTVDYNKLDFWLEEGLWPTGVVTKRWFGKNAVPYEEKKLKKTIFMSGIGDVEEATILRHVKNKAYPDIKFDTLAFSRIGENGTVTCEINDAGEADKFRSAGLKSKLFPVKVKWFRQNLKKVTGWYGAD